MTTNTPTDFEEFGGDSDEIETRTRRALEEHMTVDPNAPEVKGADDMIMVTSTSSYIVDLKQKSCSCPDNTHRGSHCKHLRRAEFAMGREPIPAKAAVECTPSQPFGALTDADPQVAVK